MVDVRNWGFVFKVAKNSVPSDKKMVSCHFWNRTKRSNGTTHARERSAPQSVPEFWRNFLVTEPEESVSVWQWTEEEVYIPDREHIVPFVGKQNNFLVHLTKRVYYLLYEPDHLIYIINIEPYLLVSKLSQKHIREFFFWYLLLKSSTKIWSSNIRSYLWEIFLRPEKQA